MITSIAMIPVKLFPASAFEIWWVNKLEARTLYQLLSQFFYVCFTVRQTQGSCHLHNVGCLLQYCFHRIHRWRYVMNRHMCTTRRLALWRRSHDEIILHNYIRCLLRNNFVNANNATKICQNSVIVLKVHEWRCCSHPSKAQKFQEHPACGFLSNYALGCQQRNYGSCCSRCRFYSDDVATTKTSAQIKIDNIDRLSVHVQSASIR